MSETSSVLLTPHPCSLAHELKKSRRITNVPMGVGETIWVPTGLSWCDQQHTLIETMKKASAHDFSKLMISSQCFQGTFIPQKPNKQHKPESLDHMSYLGIGINGHGDIS